MAKKTGNRNMIQKGSSRVVSGTLKQLSQINERLENFTPKLYSLHNEKGKAVLEDVMQWYGKHKKQADFGSFVTPSGAQVGVTVPQLYLPELASPDRLFYPTNLSQAIKYWRLFFTLDPVFGNVVEMYADLLSSDFTIGGAGVEGTVKDVFYQAMEDTEVISKLKYFPLLFLVDGEVIPHLYWDKDKGHWTYLAFLDPMYLDVTDVPFINAEPYLEMKLSPDVIKVLRANTEASEKFLRKMPQEFIEYIYSGRGIPMNTDYNVTFIPRKMTPFDIRGTSIASRLWRIFMLEDAVFNVCFAKGTPVLMANKRYKRIEEVKIGDKVFDKHGRVQSVIDAWKERPIDKQLQITVTSGITLTCTDKHKFPVWVMSEKIEKKIMAKDIKVEDYLLIPKKLESVSKRSNIERKFEIRYKNSKGVGWWSDAEYLYVQVKSIKEVESEKRGDVYNLTISGDASYLVDGQIATYNTLQTARRHAAPIKLIKLGNPQTGWIPGPEHEKKLRDMLAVAETDPQAWIIYHYGVCLKPGTKVTMADYSYKNIEDMKIGDQVVDKDGKVESVVDAWSIPFHGRLKKIRLTGGEVIEGTPEHKWPVFKMPRLCACGCGKEVKLGSSYKGNHFKRGRPFRGGAINWNRFGNHKFIEGYDPYVKITADKIQVGDYLMIPRSDQRVVERTVTDIEKQKARLLGYYLAEGFVPSNVKRKDSPYVVGFAFSGDEENTYVKDVCSILDNVVDADTMFVKVKRSKLVNGCSVFAVGKQWEKRMDSVRLNSVHGGRDAYKKGLSIAIWLVKNASYGSSTKRLSKEVMLWPRELKKQLLIGYYRGDGSTVNRQMSVNTTSQYLALQMKMLWAAFGIRANVRRYSLKKYYEQGQNWKDQWVVEVSGKDVISLREEIFGKDDRFTAIGKQHNEQWWSDDKYVYVRVKSVEDVPYNGLVYNLSVSGSHSYLVEGAIGTYNSMEAFGTTDKIMSVSREWDTIERVKLIALGVSKAFISGEVTYSSSEKGLQIFLSRLKNMRDFFEKRWITKKFFRLISVTNKFVKPTDAEIAHRVRTKRSARELYEADRYIIPEVFWTNSLDPQVHSSLLAAIQQLKNIGIDVSKSTALGAVNLDLEDELRKIKQDNKLEEEIQKEEDKEEPQQRVNPYKDNNGGPFQKDKEPEKEETPEDNTKIERPDNAIAPNPDKDTDKKEPDSGTQGDNEKQESTIDSLILSSRIWNKEGIFENWHYYDVEGLAELMKAGETIDDFWYELKTGKKEKTKERTGENQYAVRIKKGDQEPFILCSRKEIQVIRNRVIMDVDPEVKDWVRISRPIGDLYGQVDRILPIYADREIVVDEGFVPDQYTWDNIKAFLIARDVVDERIQSLRKILEAEKLLVVSEKQDNNAEGGSEDEKNVLVPVSEGEEE